MDNKTYLQESSRTVSDQFNRDIINPQMLEQVLLLAISMGEMVDQAKKAIFYGKPLEPGSPLKSLEEEGGVDAIDPTAVNPNILHGALGICTEGVELLEAVLKSMRGEAFDEVNALEEMGDVEWYMALLYRALGKTPEEAKAINIEKLQSRYPDKFSSKQAIERNLELERMILEGGKS